MAEEQRTKQFPPFQQKENIKPSNLPTPTRPNVQLPLAKRTATLDQFEKPGRGGRVLSDLQHSRWKPLSNDPKKYNGPLVPKRRPEGFRLHEHWAAGLFNESSQSPGANPLAPIFDSMTESESSNTTGRSNSSESNLEGSEDWADDSAHLPIYNSKPFNVKALTTAQIVAAPAPLPQPNSGSSNRLHTPRSIMHPYNRSMLPQYAGFRTEADIKFSTLPQDRVIQRNKLRIDVAEDRDTAFSELEVKCWDPMEYKIKTFKGHLTIQILHGLCVKATRDLLFGKKINMWGQIEGYMNAMIERCHL